MKRPLIIAFTALLGMPVIALAFFALTDRFDTKPLPTYGEVPEFSLTERSGKSFASEELKRKVWVASFLFTSCSVQCPRIAQRVQSLQNKLRFQENFRLVSITVDPRRDTPQVLTRYANSWQADPYKWLFLTGESSSIQRLVQHGFRLAADSDGGDIVHAEKLVLVDGQGKIRGYYDANDNAAMSTLQRHARRLLKETAF